MKAKVLKKDDNKCYVRGCGSDYEVKIHSVKVRLCGRHLSDFRAGKTLTLKSGRRLWHNFAKPTKLNKGVKRDILW